MKSVIKSISGRISAEGSADKRPAAVERDCIEEAKRYLQTKGKSHGISAREGRATVIIDESVRQDKNVMKCSPSRNIVRSSASPLCMSENEEELWTASRDSRRQRTRAICLGQCLVCPMMLRNDRLKLQGPP